MHIIAALTREHGGWESRMGDGHPARTGRLRSSSPGVPGFARVPGGVYHSNRIDGLRFALLPAPQSPGWVRREASDPSLKSGAARASTDLLINDKFQFYINMPKRLGPGCHLN